jgi:murein DD-endopeptidase MepM/ murein hydrolase activator NlpD
MSGLLDPTPLAWQDPLGTAGAPATTPTPVTPGAPAATPDAAAAAAPAALKAIYPLFIHATQDFHTGARYFRANRGGGRLHAAVDLIAPHLTKIRAIADGTVIQPAYFFYLGTNALEVNHPGIGVVRYGEIDMHQVVKFKAGDKVKQGDVIAYVGLLSTGSSMLHFELYDGSAKGPLTVHVPPFKRRKDLVNPTKLMEQLQKEAFGQ